MTEVVWGTDGHEYHLGTILELPGGPWIVQPAAVVEPWHEMWSARITTGADPRPRMAFAVFGDALDWAASQVVS